jgi:hypothetical protein
MLCHKTFKAVFVSIRLPVSNSLTYVSLPPKVLVRWCNDLPSDITRFPTVLMVGTIEEFGNGL